MQKKELTTKQKLNRYRVIKWSSFGGEFLSIATPFITLALANYDEWFIESPEGWKIGLGGLLALALMGIAVLLVTKKKEDNSITNGWITMIVGWFATAFIFGLLASIIDQIANIMLYGGVGLLGAFGLNIVSDNYDSKIKAYKVAKKKVEEKELQDQIEEEHKIIKKKRAVE